ncbi:hypothetical protein NIA69_02950, partial [Gemmiger formicilis]|nr:hypothetical protein [Gemmiger formicilis]
MCDGDGTLLEQCNIVRALHRLPVWEELPEREKKETGCPQKGHPVSFFIAQGPGMPGPAV